MANPVPQSRLSIALISVLSIWLQGCESRQEPSVWFPLLEGKQWVYQETRLRAGEKSVARLEVESRALPEFEQAAFARNGFEPEQVYVRHTSSGTDYYLAVSPEGIQRVAKRVIVESRARFDNTPRLVLPDAVDLGVGATWEIETQPYVLASTAAHIPWLPEANRFSLMYEIVDMDATVETVAGRFEHCIHVQAQAKISFYADPRLGYQDIQITQSEWYAKDVGLVKLVREEPLDLEMYQGGTLTLELISHHQH